MNKEILEKMKNDIIKYTDYLKKSKPIKVYFGSLSPACIVYNDNAILESEFYALSPEEQLHCIFLQNNNRILDYVIKKYSKYIKKEDTVYFCQSDYNDRIYYNMLTEEYIRIESKKVPKFEENKTIIYGDCLNYDSIKAEYNNEILTSGAKSAKEKIYEKYKNYKLTNITFCNDELNETDNLDFYSKADIAMCKQSFTIGIYTIYRDGKKKYVAYEIGERARLSHEREFDDFYECLEKAKIWYKGLSYLIEKDPTILFLG